MSYLTPTEEDRLRVFLAAELARRTRDRRLRLNAPEAVALIADEMHMAARAGKTYDEVVAVGLSTLFADQVIDGVPEIVTMIRVEVLLDEGSRLIVLRQPIRPRTEGAGQMSEPIGAIRFAPGTIALGEGKPRLRLTVENTSRRIVRVSSHFPFHRANHRLRFDRGAAQGYHLDIPAGSTVRWGPGETQEVELVRIGGEGSVPDGGPPLARGIRLALRPDDRRPDPPRRHRSLGPGRARRRRLRRRADLRLGPDGPHRAGDVRPRLGRAS